MQNKASKIKWAQKMKNEKKRRKKQKKVGKVI